MNVQIPPFLKAYLILTVFGGAVMGLRGLCESTQVEAFKDLRKNQPARLLPLAVTSIMACAVIGPVLVPCQAAIDIYTFLSLASKP